MSKAQREEQAIVDASAWLARLSGDQVDEGDARDFDAWLAAAPEHRAAYQQLLADWHAFDRHADAILEDLKRTGRQQRPSMARRGWFAAGGAALAAAMALAVLPPMFVEAPAPQVFQTARAEHRTIKLADGSTVDMDAETRLRVSFSKSRRQVTLDGGQAIFDVTHDTARPFTVAASNHIVRVVGTQFEVRNRDKALTVTVARGRVEVRPDEPGGGRTYLLTPGERLAISETGAEAMKIVDPQETFSWRSGRLVYRNQPLGEVVADLNREFVQQINIGDPNLARIPITGVIVLDNPRAVTDRLSLMLPVKTVVSPQGLTLLQK